MNIKKLDPVMIFPAAVPGAVLITAWLGIFINNNSSFTLSMPAAFLTAGIAWAAVSLLLFLCLYAVSFFSWHKWITAGVLGISCSIILQYHLGPEIFGTNIRFFEISPAFLVLFFCHFLLLALPIAAACWQRERCYKWRLRISLILILMQVVTLVYGVYSAPKFSDNYDFKEYSFSEKEKFSFGAKENIIVLVVDCMGERILKEVLTRYPESQKIFTDFTGFDRMVSPLPRTMYAVPALLTGINFPGAGKGVPEDDDHGIFLTRVCREKTSLLQLARKNGFRVEGYPFFLQTISYAPEVIHNSEAITQEVQQESVLKILEVMQERLIPVFWKEILTDESEIVPFVQRGMADGSDGLSYDQVFYRRLKNEFRTGPREKVFKYLHIHGAHDPMTTDEELATKENVLRHQQFRGSLKIVELLLQKLREHGIYDSSTIVITGDHTEKYTPEIIAFIKRPFERKNTLTFNSVSCQISQISGSVAKIANLDPNASSLFDLAFIPGSIKDVRDTKQKFPKFTPWKKLENRKTVSFDSSVQGNYQLQDNRIMIELANENTLQFADKVTVTAENASTAEQFETTLIKDGGFHDILLPELTFPDGDYLLSITETKSSVDTAPAAVTRVLPAWIRVKAGEISVLSRAPDLFHKPVLLDKEMKFHPFACWPGVRFSPGCEVKWSGLLMPAKEKILIRLPKSSGTYRAEIGYMAPPFENGYLVLTVNGQEKKKWSIEEQRENLCTAEVVPGKEGIAEISLEYRSEKKRIRQDLRRFNRIRIPSIMIRESRIKMPNSGS